MLTGGVVVLLACGVSAFSQFFKGNMDHMVAMFRYWSTLGRGTPAPHTLDPGVVMLLTVSLDGWMELLNQVHGPPSTHTRQTPQTRRHQPGRCLVCYYPSPLNTICTTLMSQPQLHRTVSDNTVI